MNFPINESVPITHVLTFNAPVRVVIRCYCNNLRNSGAGLPAVGEIGRPLIRPPLDNPLDSVDPLNAFIPDSLIQGVELERLAVSGNPRMRFAPRMIFP